MSGESLSTILTSTIKTPYGEMLLGSLGETLCLCDWKYRKHRRQIDRRIEQGTGATFKEGSSPVIREAKEQLEAYFAGERKYFTLSLHWVGTPFQQKVWEELLRIPYGSTLTYTALAHNIGSDTGVRAVAAANGSNALSIIIPCHRVVGKDGKLLGYAGGINVKRKLILLEKSMDPREGTLF